MRQTRQSEFRYRPANELSLPEGMEEYFKQQGFHLRWIRYILEGREDSRNIALRRREGYEFISKADLKKENEEWADFFDSAQLSNSTSKLICVGDVLLGKIETDRATARQQYYEDQSSAQVTRSANIAKTGSESSSSVDPRLENYAPVTNDSRSEVKLGGNPKGE